MKPWLVILAASAFAAVAQDLPAVYAPQGELILTPFATAPFPHPQRAEGHRYKDRFFSSAEHYSDNTVALFIPRGLRATGRVDLVIHFHGWNNNVTNVLRRYRLIDQFAASGRNAVLVVPQGPRDASDSFGGKLEDPNGFKRFIDETLQVLRARPGAKKELEAGNIVLSGHSGGYHVMAAILDHGGLSAQVREVWLFDALYGQTENFVAWNDREHGRFLDLYTEHGGTKEETESLMRLLKARGTPFLAANEADLQPTALKGGKLVFLFSALEHDDVVARHDTFRTFLETSLLESCTGPKGKD